MNAGPASVTPFRRPEVSDPLARVIGTLRSRGVTVKESSGLRYRAKCPTHPDTRESLAVTWRDGRVLMKCFGGCRTSDVVSALGLKMADLFSAPPRAARGPQEPIAIYTYCDLAGTIVAEKCRYEPKRFRWRRPDETAADGYRWSLDGADLPIYRWPALAGAEEVFIVEGEKSVDRLAVLGFSATCGPAGAGHWSPQFTAAVLSSGAQAVVILPDADKSGRQHGIRIAQSCFDRGAVERGIHVKVIELPDLPLAGDVVDWLDAGHTVEELRAAVTSAPSWSPDSDAKRRRARKLKKAAERQKAWRERQKVLLLSAQATGRVVGVA